VPVIAFVVICLLASLLTRGTSIGRFLYAMGDNPDAARVIGIPVRLVVLFQYVAAAFIAFLAGLVLAGENHSMNLQIIDSALIFNVFLVVVIGGISLVGGRGSVLSVVVGTVLIGVLLNGLTLLDVPVQQQSMVEAIVFLAALSIDSRLHPRNEETARQGDI
jgi:ribose transport system permease protein